MSYVIDYVTAITGMCAWKANDKCKWENVVIFEVNFHLDRDLHSLFQISPLRDPVNEPQYQMSFFICL